jgi:rare lipoprotein A
LFASSVAIFSPSIASAEPNETSGKTLQSGQASWYGPGFHGRRTASGESFNTNDLTAAHRTLPFGTRVRVVNKKTGKSVVVRINDRGPYAHGRVIDLSRASARAIGISGVGSVSLAQM